MGLMLQGNSDARAVWHHKHPVSWIVGLESMSRVRALFKSGLNRQPRCEGTHCVRMIAVCAVNPRDTQLLGELATTGDALVVLQPLTPVIKAGERCERGLEVVHSTLPSWLPMINRLELCRRRIG